ncbi:MAG: hypothetical protein C0501_19355 [Isosphaera sp.]|nr:hypothetical protein [Isosphaera sp.]
MTPHDVPRPAARWRGLLLDAALVLFVAGLGAKAAAGGRTVRDLDPGDEFHYASVAARAPESGLPSVESSPLYVLWDRLLLRAGVPAEDVPFASWAGLACLLPAAVTVLARAAGAGRVAALVAGGVLPATALVDIYPYPMHLAAVVLLLGTALAARLRPAPSAAALGLTLLLATYARPEFLYSLYLFVPAAAAGGCRLLWRRPGDRRAVLASAAVFAAGAGLLAWGFGSPKGEDTRPIIAFGQHYAYNRSLAGARTDDPWAQWRVYIRDDFGDVSTVGEAWRANPEAVLWHVRQNARALPRQAGEAFAPWVDLRRLRLPHVVPPPGRDRYAAAARLALQAALVLGLAGAAVGARRQLLGREPRDGLLPVLLVLGLVAAPATAACLLVYPRFHYLVPTAAFAAAAAAAGFRYLPFRRPAGPGAGLVLAAAGLAAVVPNRADGWCVQALLGGGENARSVVSPPDPFRASVRTLRGLGLRPPVAVVDIEGGARVYYAGLDHVPADQLRPGEGLAGAVRRLGVGAVWVDRYTACYPALRDDPEYRALSEGRETDLFRLLPVPGHPDIRLAVRRDLLPAAPE